MNGDDDLIRSMYSDAGLDGPGRGPQASQALESLRPAMRRARRRRQFAVGAAATMIVGTGTMGVLALNGAIREPELRTFSTEQPPELDGGATATTTADATDDDTDGGETDSTVGTSDVGTADGSGAAPTSTTVAPAQGVTTTLSIGDAASVPPKEPAEPATIPPVATPDPGPTTTVPVVGGAPPAPTTTIASPTPATTTTVDPATIPLNPGEVLIESVCGDIVVAVDGDDVDLVRTLPEPGFDTDVKSDGPEDVEVGYHLRDDECEIKAHVESGELVTEVKNPEGEPLRGLGSQSSD